MPAEPARAQSIAVAAAIGTAAGAALGAGRGRRAVIARAAAGAGALALSDAVARAVQRPNEIPPLWSRIVASGALAAPLGLVLDRQAQRGPVAVGIGVGSLAGALGVRPQRIALGPAVGLAVGALARRRVGARGQGTGAAVAATTMVTYRCLSAALFRDAQVSLL